MTVLVLLDIDGTLLTCFGEGRAAYYDTLGELFPGREFGLLDMAGRTDFGIWCELTGLAEGADWERFREAYARNMDVRLERRPPGILPGVTELLRALGADPRFRTGIVTGNLRAGSDVKIRRGGLGAWLEGVPGAYGDRVVDKDSLAQEIASAHGGAGGVPVRVVVVGDTLADVRCARGGGAGCLGVLTGGGDRMELSGADDVVEDLSETDRILGILERIAR